MVTQTRNAPTDRYNAQCVNGHQTTIEPGSELEERAVARQNDGFLDAIVISEEACSTCRYEDEERDRQFRKMCDQIGCALGDGSCRTKGCFASRSTN